MLKRSKLFTLAALTLLASSASFAADNEMVLINHFDNALTFTIGINPNVLPDLPTTFTVNQQASAKSQVLDIHKEAYIRIEDGHEHSGFFGVALENEKARIYGYLSKGIAYSWKGGVVTFCTPEEYKKENHC